MGRDRPPLEYLVTSSKITLESFELSRLNRAANLRKEVRQILDEWIDAEVDGRIARWVLECRRAQNPEVWTPATSIVSRAYVPQLEIVFPPLPSANAQQKCLSEQQPAQAALEAGAPNDCQAEPLPQAEAEAASSPAVPGGPIATTPMTAAPMTAASAVAVPGAPITIAPSAGNDVVRRVLQAAENFADTTATTLPQAVKSDAAQEDAEMDPQLLAFRILHGAPSVDASGIRRRRSTPARRPSYSCGKFAKFPPAKWKRTESQSAQPTRDQACTTLSIDRTSAT